MRLAHFCANLLRILFQIRAEGGDSFHVIVPGLEHKIYAGVETLDHRPPADPLSHTRESRIYRFEQLMILSEKKGQYEVFILRNSIKGASDYPGQVRGAFKIFKKGCIRFIISESGLNTGNLQLIEWENVLSLSRKSESYEQLLAHIDFETDPLMQIEARLLSQGFESTNTRILKKPAHSDPGRMHYSVFVRDCGQSLDDINLAKKISRGDYVNLAQAIVSAGRSNPPVYLPYDLKPQNILINFSKGVNHFHCIDYSSIGMTPEYLSSSLHRRIDINPAFAHAAFLRPEQKDMVSQKCFSENKTFEETITHIVADNIIATFICLMCAPHINTRAQLYDESYCESLKKFLIPELQEIPYLFCNSQPILFQTLKDLVAAEHFYIFEDFNWCRLLRGCYLMSMSSQ